MKHCLRYYLKKVWEYEPNNYLIRVIRESEGCDEEITILIILGSVLYFFEQIYSPILCKLDRFMITHTSLYHVRYLSHLALQVGSSNWVHKTRIHFIQRWPHFGTKTSQSAFPFGKAAPPHFILDPVFLIRIDSHSVLYKLVS